MDDKKKKYLIPELEVVDFSAEDIITGSAVDLFEDGGTDNQEEFPF